VSEPRRIQRKRTAGWRAPEGAKYVGRPSRWSNPFAVQKLPVELFGQNQWTVIDLNYRAKSLSDEPQIFDHPHYARLFATRFFDLHTGPMGVYEYDEDDLTAMRKQLAGRDLLCWCPLPEPGETDWCHAAVLLDRVKEIAS
jgi:Domain of unknown function (DUF4326)